MLTAFLPRATGSAKTFPYAKDVDMRKSFDGLHALVKEECQRDVRAGDLFLFSTDGSTASSCSSGTEMA